MGIVQDLVTKLQGCEENTVVAGNSQEQSDLFLEINQTCTAEANKEQVGGKKLIFNSNLFLMDLFFFYSNIFRIADSKMASVFRSFFLHLAPSSSIHVWSSGFWLWRWLLCLLTH